MQIAPEFGLHVQARLPAALAALHNFISKNNPQEQPISGSGFQGAAPIDDDNQYDDNNAFAGAEEDVDERRDAIAQKMWEDYLQVLAARNVTGEDPIDSDLEDEEEDRAEDDIDHVTE